MTKTPEELAEEYCSRFYSPHDVKVEIKRGFRDGYQAAQEHAHAALEEAEAEIDRLQSKLSDAGILTTEHLLGADNSLAKPDGWISVKDRLPKEFEEVMVHITYPIERIEKLAYRIKDKKIEWFVLFDPQGYFWNEEWVSHWMPLPQPPEEEK